MSPRRAVAFPRSSLRSKFLLIVLAGGFVPLGLVGLWLARSTQRSGEQLLRTRLDSALVHAARGVGNQWVVRRSALLSIGDDSIVRTDLRLASAGGTARARIPLPALAPAFAGLRAATQLIVVYDESATPLWVLDADSAGAPLLVPAADSLRVGGGPTEDALIVRLPIREAGGGATIGTIAARFPVGTLLPLTAGIAAGAVFGIIDRATGSTFATLPFDAMLLRRERFFWGGEDWLTASRTLDDPFIELLAAAPSGAFTIPFESATRRGVLALLLVAAVAMAVTVLLTHRVTRSLLQLADAAEAVTRGDLERHVRPLGEDEVGRLARAFNTMTENLRRTLAELSQRHAVVAVGEFASALAHEIRNPLSAVRLNLQHVEERLAADTALREPVHRALRDVDRLDRTVAGALRVARTGRMAMGPTNVRSALEAATRAAAAEFAAQQVVLDPLPAQPTVMMVRGNSAALEQLFLNLLLNAAQASRPGSRAGIDIDVDVETVLITVRDSGAGFEADARVRAFEAFFTTKAEGTGLGLTVARRIAAAHGGAIEIESAPGVGARVLVRLPLAHAFSLASW
jgi:two-component system sensor histidine kinase AtoS